MNTTDLICTFQYFVILLGSRKQSLTIAAAAAATSVSMDIALAGASPKAFSRGGSEENVVHQIPQQTSNSNNSSLTNVNAKEIIGRNPSTTTVAAELHVPAVTSTTASSTPSILPSSACPCCASCCPIAQAYGTPQAVSFCNGQNSTCAAMIKEGGVSAAAAIRRRSGDVVEVEASGGDGKINLGKIK